MRLNRFEDSRVSVHITTHAPDRRRRDLDNINKALLDCLTHAGVYTDDSQIDDLHLVRGHIEKPGFVVVRIEAI